MIAHGGGIDELAIFLFPIVFGLGFWLITRQRKTAGHEGEDTSPDDTATEGEPPSTSAPRKDGAARLRSLMDEQRTPNGGEPVRIRARKDPVARLRGLMDDDADPATPRDGHTRPESR